MIRLFKVVKVSSHIRYVKNKNELVPVLGHSRKLKKVVSFNKISDYLKKGYSFI